MPEFWVIDIKCKALPNSPLPQDGSEYYFSRSVVPGTSKDEAVEMLIEHLKYENIIVDKMLETIRYEDGDWSNDEYNVKDSFEDAQESHEIEPGCFVSEKLQT